MSVALFSVFAVSYSHAEQEHHDHHAMHEMAVRQPIKRSLVNYTIPSIQLIREDKKQVDLISELNDGRAVVLNFFYTSCTEICPLTSGTFSQLQTSLGNDIGNVHLISISIDPEQDTPEILSKYAKKYNAQSQWNFYTSTVEASVAAQKAFDAYRGDKMSHVPITYLRARPGEPWLRSDGFTSPDELLKFYRELTAEK